MTKFLLFTRNFKQTTVLLIFLLLGCEQPRRTADALFYQVTEGLSNYNLKSPDAKYFLPYVLEEISGLSYVSPGVIACVQDEEGKIFFYNHRTRKIVLEIRFGKSGDYEGIEVVGNKAYVINSKGDIYSFPFEQFHLSKVEKLKTELNKTNDTEGLAYNPSNNSLIIACKGEAGLKSKKKKGRGFYNFSLDDNKFNSKIQFNIKKKDIKEFLENYKDFEYESNRINFHPSGIAVHPTTNLLYIIASTGKLMLITDLDGTIKGSVPLDPRLLGQPEGICFAPNGDMFISSEGQGDKGYILKFDMKK
ncbi:MAG: SdiA-regulated domain-containing protein [Reichenbachiella sp.]